MRRLSMILVLAAGLALAGSAYAAPNCKTGVVCGNACIAKGKVCHITPAPAKNCSTGKLCGKTCIKKTDVCHKPS
jgi:hypothetical protein